jgi:hypothetical protein
MTDHRAHIIAITKARARFTAASAEYDKARENLARLVAAAHADGVPRKELKTASGWSDAHITNIKNAVSMAGQLAAEASKQ